MAALDQASLAAFESRAREAEQRLAVLEAKVLAGKGSPSNGGAVDAGQYVAALQELRALLVKAKEEQERLEAENSRLETENSKLKYQVKHLKWAVVEGDEKLAAAQKQ